jgi:calcium-dependent protein kinase
MLPPGFMAAKLSTSFAISPGDFVKVNLAPITDTYQFIGVLGSGSFAEVRKAIHVPSQSVRAVKSIPVTYASEDAIDRLMKEVSILKLLDHPHIIRIFEVFRNKDKLFIVTELCTGGELFDRIKELKRFTENMAAKYMAEIVSAVMHCHERGVVHRDLKPENLLFESIRHDARLKLIDFGTSHVMVNDRKMTRLTGSHYYIAPEVIGGSYDEKCDVWSLGVILYIMLVGMPPFNGRTEAEILSRVQSAPVSFTHGNWTGVSEEVKALILKMLKKDPTTRLSISEVFSDPWLQARSSSRVQDRELASSALSRLDSFRTESRLQKAVFSYIVSQMLGSEEFEKLSQAFKAIDLNGDGLLSTDELRIAAYKCGIDIDVEEIIRHVDSDRNGFVNYSEFLTATVNRKQAFSRERVQEVFNIFDVNKDGKISLEELKEALGGEGKNDSYFRKIIMEADTNGDGEIDLDEFIDLMSQCLNE